MPGQPPEHEKYGIDKVFAVIDARRSPATHIGVLTLVQSYRDKGGSQRTPSSHNADIADDPTRI
jgi:hypothetical protein